MFYLAGIVITVFLALTLAGKRNKSRADIILIVWLCVIAFHLVLYYLFITGKAFDYPALLGIHPPYPLLHGPLLYLYTAELTGQQPKNRIIKFLHFLPVFIIYLFMIPFFSLPAETKIAIYQNRGAGYETLSLVCFMSIIFSGIGYVTASLFLLRKYRKTILSEFSNIGKINLAWLRYLVYGIALIWLVIVLDNDNLLFGAVVIYVFFLGFFGIRQVGIFSTQAPGGLPAPEPGKREKPVEPGPNPGILDMGVKPATEEINPEIQKVKYERSGLDEEKASQIYNRLVESMRDQQLFTDPDLTLASLAKNLEIHPNHLSQVINSYEGKNFYDYINCHRVTEFKKLAPLPANKNYTLLSLAYECGFNSKTSFNRNFKKATGLSPSQWLQEQHIMLQE